ncbi:hypothetical protein [Phytoactinopolyspora mesophila]|uniref:Uncharacterized protein n=1 Tax=Phytoactinopolyspora mesophila TaxID=2650750 RepID=A0A7K3MB43_9ACTN|nr:hypothetical protein [Phytoactinopolyspora mesophila]NDL60476.1 hypothetical protein [Phytoactinopolyspora mesophila]
MELVALVISIAALALAAAALRQARRAARPGGQANHAHDSSHGVQHANEAAPAGSGRDRTAGREQVAFTLRQLTDTTYELRNRGTGAAYSVKFRAHRLGKSASFKEFPAGHAEEFTLTPTDDPDHNIIEIKWHVRPDRSDAEQHKLLRVT